MATGATSGPGSLVLLTLTCVAACGGAGLSGSPAVDAASLSDGTSSDLAASCSDGVKDQDESDVDCGGTICLACEPGRGCNLDSDCSTHLCIGGSCRVGPSCTDGRQDGDETDVDCGGTVCPKCVVGGGCKVARDCLSGACRAKACVTPLTLGFSAPTSYPLPGSHPTGFVGGDFNGDKRLDIAVADASGDVQLLLGKGDGTLRAAVAFANGGAGADQIASADFDGDGRSDVATVAPGGTGVSILRGTANGLSVPSLLSLLNNAPEGSVAAADFDGDGKVDVAAGPKVVFFGAGLGSFKSPATVGVSFPAFQWPLIAADFTGKGLTDLVDETGVVTAARNHNFSMSWTNHKWIQVQSRAVGDLNGDGKLDLVNSMQSLDLLIYPGMGDGTFGAANSAPVGELLAFIGIGDFNQDGFLDVAGFDALSGTLRVHAGDGTGSIKLAAGSFAAGGLKEIVKSWSLLIQDFNQDTKPDVAILFSSPQRVTVLINTSR